MSFTEDSLEIYRKIEFVKRYEAISKQYQFDETFEKYSIDYVQNLIEQFGYKPKFIKNGMFFKIVEKANNIEFYFHICLKYGLVELIIGGENIITKEPIQGGSFGNIFKDINHDENGNEQVVVKKPCFRTYEDLKKIFEDSFSIYEDFKKEIIKSINTPLQ